MAGALLEVEETPLAAEAEDEEDFDAGLDVVLEWVEVLVKVVERPETVEEVVRVEDPVAEEDLVSEALVEDTELEPAATRVHISFAMLWASVELVS